MDGFLILVLALLILGCLFPGSGHRYGPDFGEVLANTIAGVVVFVLFCGALNALVGLFLLGEWLLG